MTSRRIASSACFATRTAVTTALLLGTAVRVAGRVDQSRVGRSWREGSVFLTVHVLGQRWEKSHRWASNLLHLALLVLFCLVLLLLLQLLLRRLENIHRRNLLLLLVLSLLLGESLLLLLTSLLLRGQSLRLLCTWLLLLSVMVLLLS